LPSRRPSTRARSARDHASSFDRLRAYLEARGSFRPDELEQVRSLFRPRHLDKGAFLQRAGDPARDTAFVANGCLRSFVVDAKGKVHIVRFAPEDWWITDSESLLTGQPATLFIDAIEPSDVLLIDPPSHQRLVDAVPSYAAAYRVGLQRFAAAKQKRVVAALSETAEERYLDFAARYPSILRRVPQRMLASYLGIAPETLSRIRRKRAAPTS
jgi:CRP-like cAMP-binding protein